MPRCTPLLLLLLLHCGSPVAVVFVGGACHHVIVCYDDAVVPLHEVLLTAVRCKQQSKKHKTRQQGNRLEPDVAAQCYCCGCDSVEAVQARPSMPLCQERSKQTPDVCTDSLGRHWQVVVLDARAITHLNTRTLYARGHAGIADAVLLLIASTAAVLLLIAQLLHVRCMATLCNEYKANKTSLPFHLESFCAAIAAT
jgi:hypothetical protein